MSGYKGTRFEYNDKGFRETGFNNYIDHELFGHPSNPEYQELCQCEERTSQFQGWLDSVEIQNCPKKACETLNIQFTDDMNIISDKFFNLN